MQIFKRVVTTLSLAVIGVVVSLPQAASAGDRRVVVGTRHMSVSRHVPQTTIVTRYPNTVIYSRTPRVIYQGAPTVVIASPFVNTRPYNYYQNWNQGWRSGWNNRSNRYRQPNYCAPKRGGVSGHRHSQRDRRW